MAEYIASRSGNSIPVVATAPYESAEEITAGDGTASVAAGRGFVVFATVAGDVKITLASGDAITISVPVGATVLPFSVTAVWTAGTDATATYFSVS